MRNSLVRWSALACIVWLGLPPAAWSRTKPSGEFKVGMAFRRFVPDKAYDWRGAQTQALVTTIWYPASRDAQERPPEIPGISGFFVVPAAAQDAKLSTQRAKFPLIVLSHGTGGSGLSVAWFGAALASHGYIVAAVNHPGNNATEPYSARGFATWWERARDLSTVIDFLLADERFGGRIDDARIGAAGFSLGGYTMIEIAGGLTDPNAFRAFCASPQKDGICKSPPEFPTLFEDFEKLSRSDPEFQAALRHAGDSYRDPRVRAVFAMAPALGPAFPAAGLARISLPVAIVAGESDANVPVASSARYFAANIPGATLTLFPGSVGHYVFLDTCTEPARKQNPTVCQDAEGVDRDGIHAKTVSLAVKFFEKALQ